MRESGIVSHDVRADRLEPEQPVRSLTAELFGTFMLTFAAAGGEVVAEVSHGAVDTVAKAAAPGLVVMALVYALGKVSGAHFNPAVTLAFALRSAFPWRRVPGYWVAQLAGAVAAAAVLRGLFGPVRTLGATLPHFRGPWAALTVETILTALLVCVVLSTATQHSLIGPHAAVPVGGTIVLAGLVAGPITGASMNPARSLGPAIVAPAWQHWWVYVAGPFAGALVATGLVLLWYGPPRPEEDRAAGGDAAEGD
jgi:aquaporin Z